MKRYLSSPWGCWSSRLPYSGCASHPYGPGWTTLIDGDNGLDNWNRIGMPTGARGGASWPTRARGVSRCVEGVLQGFRDLCRILAATDTNSGIFLRASDPVRSAPAAYEVNIWDIRPDPTYGTGDRRLRRGAGTILHKAGARGHHTRFAPRHGIDRQLNGTVTVNTNNAKFASGPFALQYGAGVKGAPAARSSGARCKSSRCSARPSLRFLHAGCGKRRRRS